MKQMDPNSPLVSVVTPAFNECEALPITVNAIAKQLADVAYEIIVVDDGSTDITWDVITDLCSSIPGFSLAHCSAA